MFKTIGTVIALSISNSVILPIRFPIALYKKLKKMKLTIADLEVFEPDIVKTIHLMERMVKNNEDISTIDLTFSIPITQFNETQTYDIIENGSNITVTNENFESYVKNVIDYYFNKHIEKEYSSFAKGFLSVKDFNAFQLLLPDEFDKYASGVPFQDWDKLKDVTVYANGYSKDSKEIKWFWEIYDEISESEKSSLLKFSTGSDKIQAGNTNFQFIIERATETKNLPISHTCMNTFCLPQYESKEIMKKKILIALNYSSGFGLL